MRAKDKGGGPTKERILTPTKQQVENPCKMSKFWGERNGRRCT